MPPRESCGIRCRIPPLGGDRAARGAGAVGFLGVGQFTTPIRNPSEIRKNPRKGARMFPREPENPFHLPSGIPGVSCAHVAWTFKPGWLVARRPAAALARASNRTRKDFLAPGWHGFPRARACLAGCDCRRAGSLEPIGSLPLPARGSSLLVTVHRSARSLSRGGGARLVGGQPGGLDLGKTKTCSFQWMRQLLLVESLVHHFRVLECLLNVLPLQELCE